MHELGIMYHIVEQVLRVAEENKVTEIDTLVLQVGELSSVIPKYLHACYPAAVDGTLLEKTKLEIEILPANAICHACGKVFGAVQHNNICPNCAKSDYEMISGQEFYLKEIRAY
ncbi:MAG: hydrogenase maturation nickel metallochaperone HypA [Oscillospiraceae bacterium]